MPDIYGILNTASRSLLTQQKAIDVTGQNIANVNTPGYSRQRVVMEPSTPINFEPGQMGTGVKAAEIQRIYDGFIGGQINGENAKLGQWEATESGLARIELIFNESSGVGLQQAMGEFWGAWQDLINNPSGYPERTVLRSTSQTLARTFNTMSANLHQIQLDYDRTIVGTLDEINGLSRQIVDLNDKISQVEISGQNSNDYRDQREQLLKELSGLIEINTYENDQGQVTVLTGNGKPLVQSPQAYALSTVTNANGLQDVVWMDRSGTTIDITASIGGGELKGWLDVRDGLCPGLPGSAGYSGRSHDRRSQCHSPGRLWHDHRSWHRSAVIGQPFFTGTSATTMAVDPAIVADVNRIAAATTAATVPGGNGNAVAMANLQGQLTMNGGSATFDNYYSALASGVGNDVRNASANHEYEEAMIDPS